MASAFLKTTNFDDRFIHHESGATQVPPVSGSPALRAFNEPIMAAMLYTHEAPFFSSQLISLIHANHAT